MLDDKVLDRLAAWLHAEGGIDVARELVGAEHPARLWVADRSGDSFDALVKVLANGGHLPLLASLVLVVRARASEPPPLDVEIELAHALRRWDEDRTQAVGSGEAAASDVFVCYAHEDTERIERIVRVLQNASLSVFRDTESIRPGESIALSVARAAGACRAAVVVVSAASLDSVWVAREMSLLLAARSTGNLVILPVVIDDVPLPDSVRDLFAIDLRWLGPSMDDATVEQRLQPLIRQLEGGRDATGCLFQS
jgi:hypothetical protein